MPHKMNMISYMGLQAQKASRHSLWSWNQVCLILMRHFPIQSSLNIFVVVIHCEVAQGLDGTVPIKLFLDSRVLLHFCTGSLSLSLSQGCVPAMCMMANHFSENLWYCHHFAFFERATFSYAVVQHEVWPFVIKGEFVIQANCKALLISGLCFRVTVWDSTAEDLHCYTHWND